MLRALRFLGGAAAGFALWWYATPAYNDVLCRLLHIFGPFLKADGRSIIAMRAGMTDAHIPADLLTYNIVLFAGLVAAVTPRLFALVAATIALLAFHPLALAIAIEAAFTKSQLWISLEFLYRIAGMFAIAFVAWYAATPAGARGPQRETSRKSARAGRARPRTATPGR